MGTGKTDVPLFAFFEREEILLLATIRVTNGWPHFLIRFVIIDKVQIVS